MLDSCVWGGALHALRARGHDVEWVGERSVDPGDDRILAEAAANGRVLVTLDKDFGELAILRRVPHCGIIRIVGIAARGQAERIDWVVANFAEALTSGGIVTVDSKRVRIRPASID